MKDYDINKKYPTITDEDIKEELANKFDFYIKDFKEVMAGRKNYGAHNLNDSICNCSTALPSAVNKGERFYEEDYWYECPTTECDDCMWNRDTDREIPDYIVDNLKQQVKRYGILRKLEDLDL